MSNLLNDIWPFIVATAVVVVAKWNGTNVIRRSFCCSLLFLFSCCLVHCSLIWLTPAIKTKRTYSYLYYTLLFPYNKLLRRMFFSIVVSFANLNVQLFKQKMREKRKQKKEKEKNVQLWLVVRRVYWTRNVSNELAIYELYKSAECRRRFIECERLNPFC